MVVGVKREVARCFVFCPQLSRTIFLPFVFEVFRNRFRRHGCSVAEHFRASCLILATLRQFLGGVEIGGGYNRSDYTVVRPCQSSHDGFNVINIQDERMIS